MINNMDIVRVFGKLIKKRLGILAIRANQKDAPLPAGEDGPFATVKIISKTSAGIDAESYSYNAGSDALDERLKGRRRITASINLFRNSNDYEETAMDMAEEFKTYLESSEAMLEFSSNEIGLIGSPLVRDLSEIEINTFEGRANIDVECYISSELTTTVLDIREVTIEGEIENTGIDDINLIITE